MSIAALDANLSCKKELVYEDEEDDHNEDDDSDDDHGDDHDCSTTFSARRYRALKPVNLVHGYGYMQHAMFQPIQS